MINVYQPTLGKEELDALEKVFESNLEKASEWQSSKKSQPTILNQVKNYQWQMPQGQFFLVLSDC